jgi:transposase InsO family protein
MMDENIVAASCLAVYTVLRRAGLSKKWAISAEERKSGFEQPRSVREQWHTDFSYVRTGGNYYYVAVLDGYSRMVLAWDLFMSMGSWTVRTVVQEAKERYP